MLESAAQWLDRVGPFVFLNCVAILVLVDSTAIAAVFLSRSRAAVNRWTGPVLALNVLLIATGVGVPASMYAVKLAVRAVAPFATSPLARDSDPRR